MIKSQDIFGIFLLICLIILFCIGDYNLRRGIAIGIVGLVIYLIWYMGGGDR